jgi:uncharacterized protein (TIGR02246 family)
MKREDIERWVELYEEIWREPGTGRVAELFAPDAVYLQGPYREPVIGLEAIAAMWDDERPEGEHFDMTSEAVAVDGDTAVVRAEVTYSAPREQQWRDLWIVVLDDDGLATHFEEWPIAPR